MNTLWIQYLWARPQETYDKVVVNCCKSWYVFQSAECIFSFRWDDVRVNFVLSFLVTFWKVCFNYICVLPHEWGNQHYQTVFRIKVYSHQPNANMKAMSHASLPLEFKILVGAIRTWRGGFWSKETVAFGDCENPIRARSHCSTARAKGIFVLVLDRFNS